MHRQPVTETRPWGTFTVLDEGARHKVKRIEIGPGHKLSYQSHAFRAEHWVVVTGRAQVVVDGIEHDLAAGQSIYIPAGAKHRIGNPGPDSLMFVEVQRGSYLGEDDITRYEDDYGRV